MNVHFQNHWAIFTAAIFLAGTVAGCSKATPEASQDAAGTTPAASANLTPQQEAGAKASAQQDGEMRAAAARSQLSQHH